MNIVEIIRFYGEANALKALAEEMSRSGDLKKVQEENGCVYFEFFFPAEGDGLILLEKWESEEALELHHGTEMMKNLLTLIKKYELKLTAEKYTV